ncbi:MAG: preprotein translocase subunit SecG [Pseudomonadota bacterium]
MQNVILVVHILACIVMTAVIMLQKSEGGALGIGGGGGGLMSGRGAAGALVRTTMIVGGIFFMTSLGLTTLANRTTDDRSAVERTVEVELGETVEPGDLLDPSTPLLDDPISPPANQIAPPLDLSPEESVDESAPDTPQE